MVLKSTDSSSIHYLLNVRALTPFICPCSCFVSIPAYHYGSLYHLLRKGKPKIRILDVAPSSRFLSFGGSHFWSQTQTSLRVFFNTFEDWLPHNNYSHTGNQRVIIWGILYSCSLLFGGWALSDQKGMSYLAKKKSLTKRAYTDH